MEKDEVKTPEIEKIYNEPQADFHSHKRFLIPVVLAGLIHQLGIKVIDCVFSLPLTWRALARRTSGSQTRGYARQPQ